MTTNTEHLDNRTVLRILSQVTTEIHEQLPSAERAAVPTLPDARATVAALLEQQGMGILDPKSIFAQDQADPVIARRVLDLLLTNSETARLAEEAVADPPSDSQKSLELAIGGAVILGSLVAWLQTAVEIEVRRKNGKTEFRFNLKKAATDRKTLADLAKTVSKLIS